jgi:hypothetical protein
MRKVGAYQAQDSNDVTQRILQAFVDHLPDDGKRNIAEDINGCETNTELKQLAMNLFTAVLIPSRSALL